MGDMLGNALSALVSYQRAMATTSHNIANADTEGYSRQRVEFATRLPQQFGDLSVGSGVNLASVRRVYDDFAASQLRDVTASFNQMDSYYQLAMQMDSALADPETGLSAALSRFYNSIQDVADDPGSISARQLLLAEASSLSDRIAGLDEQMNVLEKQVNLRLSSSVAEVNDLAQQIAEVNKLVMESRGKFGSAANDLLDQRDQALLKLNELLGIKTVAQDDGSINVFIGNGESLVLGQKSMQLATVPSAFEPGRNEVALVQGEGRAVISEIISGGSIGGVLSFRDSLLADSRSELGRITMAVAETFNQQHRAGLDLHGQLGGDLFSVPGPQLLRASSNLGNAELQAQVADIGALSGREMLLRYDGSNWHFFARDSGAPIANVSGSGSNADPFRIEGLSIVVANTPAAGDQFLLRPTAAAAAGLSLQITDPSRIAAAAPTRGRSDANNSGGAQLSATEVVDVSHPALMQSAEISFLDSGHYQINGAGAFAYTSGEPIVINGNRLTVTGVPAAGDRFFIEANSGGVADNRNALRLAGTESQRLLNDGTVSVQDALSSLVGDIAVATRSAEINRQSQQNLLAQTEARQQEISGVNLDEEAAQLLKFQQAYQAAAQATSAANDMFQALLSAFR